MSQVCKYCNKPMVLIKNGKKNLFDENTWIYQCQNIDCEHEGVKLHYDVCEECESEEKWWEEL